MSYEPPRERDPIPRFIGRVLLVVGVLWMALAGICTVAMLVQSGGSANGESGYLVIFAIVGFVALLAGFGIFMLGRALARN